MNIEIIIQDNSELFLQELENKMPEILNACGNELYKSIYTFMTEDKIVDTGRLRGSISYSTPYENYKNPMMFNNGEDFIENVKERNSVVYGSNVEYASNVELGTSRQRARNYIKTGTFRAVPQLKGAVENILRE